MQGWIYYKNNVRVSRNSGISKNITLKRPRVEKYRRSNDFCGKHVLDYYYRYSFSKNVIVDKIL